MKEFEDRLVHFDPADIEKELAVPCPNYVEKWLVLYAHDEMTAQANDN
jgi:hypothetical protein